MLWSRWADSLVVEQGIRIAQTRVRFSLGPPRELKEKHILITPLYKSYRNF